MRRIAVWLMLTLSTLAPHTAVGQESRTDKSSDEILLEVAEKVPEFAGVLGGDTLKILVTARRPGILEEARAALDEAFGKFQFEHYATMELVEVKYSWIQLFGWYRQIWGTAWSFEGTVTSDIDERANRLAFGVLDPETQAQAIEDEAERLGIPDDALIVVQQGPVQLQRGENPSRQVPPENSLPWWLIAGAAMVLIVVSTLVVLVQRRRTFAGEASKSPG